MSLTLAELLGIVADRETPVVWMDPGTREELWAALPEALESKGFRVYMLEGVADHASLMGALRASLGLGTDFRGEMNALKDALLGLDDGGELGWTLVFRRPDTLRQNDEEAFEDFLEVVETAHEILMARQGRRFKLVLTD